MLKVGGFQQTVVRVYYILTFFPNSLTHEIVVTSRSWSMKRRYMQTLQCQSCIKGYRSKWRAHMKRCHYPWQPRKGQGQRSVLSLQAWISAPDTGKCPVKTELCPVAAALQRTQLSGVKLRKNIISYRRLKTQKYSVSRGFSFSGFYFYEHFNRQKDFIPMLYCFFPCLGQLLLWKHFIFH